MRRDGCGEGGKFVSGVFLEVSDGGSVFLVFVVEFANLLSMVFGTSDSTLSHGIQ